VVIDRLVKQSEFDENRQISVVEAESELLPNLKTRLVLSYGDMLSPDGTVERSRISGLNAFDRMVMETVASLALVGQEVVSPLNIYRVMTGDIQKTGLSAKMRNAIVGSLDKCSRFRVKIRLQAEDAVGEGIRAVDIQAALLNTTAVTIHRYGHLSTYYRVHELPALYQYANRLNKNPAFQTVVKLPLEVFDTPVNKTENSLFLQDCLIRTLNRHILSQDSDEACRIPWGTLYQVAAIGTDSRQEKARIRDRAKTMLLYWKNLGFLESYTAGDGGILAVPSRSFFRRWNPEP